MVAALGAMTRTHSSETPPTRAVAADKEKARTTLRELIAELARIAAAEDDAAERRQDMARSCSTR